MSGTSMDGVDAALVAVRGRGPRLSVELLQHSFLPYAPRLRARLRAIAGGSAREIALMNYELGGVFAEAALRCMRDSGTEGRSIAAIASHGQTIAHVGREGRAMGATLQIAEPAVIAARTGVRVVSNFRAADIALGGQGAPLVPYADYVLFRGAETRLVQNIGGIGNITVVTPALDDLIAFDTGPGNCLIDEGARRYLGRACDRDGRVARSGRPDGGLLKRLLAHPFVRRRPPKSTGTDVFSFAGLGLDPLVAGLEPRDVIATLTHYTARTIAVAHARHVAPRFKASGMVVTGGGVRNRYLLELVREAMAPMRVETIEEHGIPGAAKEAMSFAVLAYETLAGRPSNVPGATGASGPAVLGSIDAIALSFPRKRESRTVRLY
jgi:anhydro-N-acetylmuramic acid kinase